MNVPEVPVGFQHTEIGILPEDWRVAPLRNLVTLMTNGFVGVAKKHYVSRGPGITYIQGFNVLDGRFNLFGIKRVSEKFHAEHQRSCLRAGDMLTVQTGDVGLTTVVTPELAGANCHALIITRFKNSVGDSRFYMRLFNSDRGRQSLRAIETGTTMKHLNVGDMLDFVVPIPPIKEQIEIANALDTMASTIYSLERLISKKQAVKQGMMQQLLTGKTRLPGFTHPWRLRRINEMLSYEQPGRFLVTTSKQLDAGPVPVLTAGKTFILGYTNESHGIYTAQPVIIFDDFTTASKYVDFAFKAKSSAMKILSAKAEVNLRFIYERMQLIDFPLSDHKRYWISEYSKQELLVPDEREQIAISSAIADAEDEINNLREQLAKTHVINQGMMQELLTGRTRLRTAETAV